MHVGLIICRQGTVNAVGKSRSVEVRTVPSGENMRGEYRYVLGWVFKSAPAANSGVCEEIGGA